MMDLLNLFEMEYVSCTEKEQVVSNGIVVMKIVSPCEKTGMRYLIKVEYQCVFTVWEDAWYSRYYSDFKDIQKDLEMDLTIIHSVKDKVVYRNEKMALEGFPNWWDVNIEYIEGLMTERVVY